MFHMAINVSTSLSSSSFWEPSSYIYALVSSPIRQATIGSSITSLSRSISSLAKGGIGSREVSWNRSVSTMCFARTSLSWSGYYHMAFILILIILTCSSSFSNATIFRKSFKALANVIPKIKVARRLC